MKKIIGFSLLSLCLFIPTAHANTRYHEPGWTGDLGLTGYYSLSRKVLSQ